MEGLGENQIIDEESVQDAPDYRFVVKNFSNENDIIQELEKTRLIVDLSEEPNLYTQIAGISAGIPQVNRVQTEYVDHLKNGYVLSKGDKELEKAILLDRKNSRIHRSTLDREMGRMDERTSWIKNYKYPIFSKSAQAVGEIRWSFLLD